MDELISAAVFALFAVSLYALALAFLKVEWKKE